MLLHPRCGTVASSSQQKGKGTFCCRFQAASFLLGKQEIISGIYGQWFVEISHCPAHTLFQRWFQPCPTVISCSLKWKFISTPNRATTAQNAAIFSNSSLNQKNAEVFVLYLYHYEGRWLDVLRTKMQVLPTVLKTYEPWDMVTQWVWSPIFKVVYMHKTEKP